MLIYLSLLFLTKKSLGNVLSGGIVTSSGIPDPSWGSFNVASINDGNINCATAFHSNFDASGTTA